MAFYRCSECGTYYSIAWGMLKGHMVRTHKRDDLKDAKEDAFASSVISQEEYNRGKEGLETADFSTPSPPPGSGQIPPNNPPGGITPSNITEYVEEPVERLRQVLLVNGGQQALVDTVTKIMGLSRWLWGNPYELEGMLVAQFGSAKLKWVQQCVAQYIRGVVLPDDVKGISPPPYAYGQPGPYYNPGSYPGYPGQSVPAGAFGPPTVSAETQELRAEVARMREDRQKEHEQQLLERIKDLEKKLETGGQIDPTVARLEAIEKKLDGGGQATTMTIYDGQGNPMVLPYDRSFVIALTRKQDAEAELVKTRQFAEMFNARGGSDERLTPVLKALEDKFNESAKKVEELTKTIQDDRIKGLEARVKAAEDLALSGTGEGKGVLEFAEGASADIREGAMALGKDIKDGVTESIEKLTGLLTKRSATPVTALATPRSPDQIADIMESENAFLSAIGEK